MGVRKTSLLWGIPFVLGALGQGGFSIHAWGATDEEGAWEEGAEETAGSFATQAAERAYPEELLWQYRDLKEQMRLFRITLKDAKNALQDINFDIQRASEAEKEWLLTHSSSKTYAGFRKIVSGAKAKEREFQEQRNAILKQLFEEPGEEKDLVAFWDKKALELEKALGL
jgi:hypothetical protein